MADIFPLPSGNSSAHRLGNANEVQFPALSIPVSPDPPALAVNAWIHSVLSTLLHVPSTVVVFATALAVPVYTTAHSLHADPSVMSSGASRYSVVASVFNDDEELPSLASDSETSVLTRAVSFQPDTAMGLLPSEDVL